MKNYHLLIVLLFLSFSLSAQKIFVLKTPNSEKLKQEFVKSNYQMNTILTHLEKNYTVTSGKLDIKLDPDFDNAECGFTKKFKSGIVYTIFSCGEAAPQKEKIFFPKTKTSELKKWIEAIHRSEAEDNNNKWYKGKNEYAPKDEGPGCYYKIIQTKTQSIIDIFCGC